MVRDANENLRAEKDKLSQFYSSMKSPMVDFHQTLQNHNNEQR